MPSTSKRRSNRDGIADKWRRSLWGRDAMQLDTHNVQAAIVVLRAQLERAKS